MTKNLLLFFFILTLSTASWAQTLTTTRVSADDAGNPLVGGSTQQVVFGFNVDKTSGATNLTNLVISTGATDPSTVFSSVALYSSGNNFAAATNTNATVTFHSGDITFAGNPTNLFSFGAGVSNRNFYVVATILSSVSTTSGGVPQITLSLTETGTTYSSAVTETAFSFSGSTYNFQALIADFTQNADASTAIGDQNGVELMDFTVLSSSTSAGQNINTQLVFTFDTDVTNILENWDLQVGGADIPGTEIYTLNGAGTQLTITAFTAVDVSTSKNFQLFADIKSGALSTNDFTISLTSIGATATPGVVESFTTFTNSIDVTALTADFTQNTDAATAVAGQTSVEFLDFTVLSNAAGTAHTLNPPLVLTFNKDVSGFLSNWDLRVGGSDIPGSETYTLNGAGTQLTIAAFTNVDITTSKNFQLFADVGSGALVTDDFTITLAEAGVTLSGGYVETFGTLTNSIDIVTSQLSDITLTGGTTASINYRTFVANSINDDQSNSVTLADFSIRDGGASDDADNKGMSVTAIQIQVTNAGNLSQIALFDDNGNTEIAGTEQTVVGTGTQNITFTPSSPISITDHGTFAINVRATFKSAVTDKQSLQISIVSATAAGGNLSGFSPVGTWASTQTASNTNIIAVSASKLVFLANPPSTPINTNFSLSVKAVDGNPYNNIDLDYIGKVDLTATGGGGTLSAGAQSLSPNLVAGQFTWNQLKITQSATYTLDASDDAYTGQTNNPTDIGDASGSVVISSSPSTITQPAALELCYGGNAQTLGNIVITETDPAGFSAGGTFSLTLPSGFLFDQSVTTPPVVGGGSDISGATALSYPNANTAEFSYTISGTANTNTITIGGLKVSRPHPGGNSPAATGTLNITRSGGTAAIAGVAPGTVLGTVSAALGSPAPVGLGFTVQKINSNDVDVAAGETRFSQNSNPVRLVGSPSGGTITNVFSGQGVTFVSGEYRFNPQSLSPGTYPITLKQNTGSGTNCEFQVVKDFEVYTTNITNLNAQYCTNSPQTSPMNVDSYIATNYPNNAYYSGWTLNRFIYWDTPTFTQQDIVSPANNIFDPKLSTYQTIYSATGTTYGTIGIWIGFIIQGTYDADGAGIVNTPVAQSRTVWQLIAVRPAPSVSFTILKTSFCADETPVTLTGNPANSNSTGDDFFSITPIGQAGALNSSSAPVTWSFNPQAVSNVTLGTPQTVTLTYTYRDPATGCSGTSAPTNITVNSRPLSVLPGSITGGISKAICQGENLTSFEAAPNVNIIYKWYGDQPLSNMIISGNSFTPPSFDNTVPGTTNFWVTQTIAGCESNKQPSSPTTALQLAVTVNATPTQPVPNFDIEYCVGETINANDFKILGGTNIRWYKDGVLVLDNVSTPNLTQITTAPANGLGIDNTVAATHKFEITQTANGCEGKLFPTHITVTIKPLPSLSISANVADIQKICTTGGTVTFKGLDQGNPTQNGTWSTVGNSFAAGALAPNGTFGTADLNTINLTPNDYVLKYDYTNAGGCSGSTTTNLKVLPKVNLVVSPLDSCAGTFVRLNNLSTIDIGGLATTSTVQNTKWNFSDGSGAEGNGPILPPYLNNGRTKGTYFSPEHKFSNTGSFTLQFTVTTSDGCNYSGTKQLNIFPKPNINFNWANVCRDATTNNTSTTFQAVETSNPALALDKFYWNFLVNHTLDTASVTNRKSANPIVKYNMNGTDSVQLIVTTLAQCRDTIQKIVYVVPKFKRIVTDTSYLQGFDAGPDSWLTGGENSSWSLGKPNGSQFQGDAGTGTGWAWDTNLTGNSNPGEKSWVLSQCFNFSASKKPIISLDIWSDTPQGVEGAVLQYNENGNIEDDASWKVVGEVGSGKNWYDAQGIASSPGNQSIGDVGWTGNEVTSPGKYSGWKKAIFKLDDLIGKSNVVFRVAFGGGPGKTDGFTFDNVFIGERSRIVLLENFTNSGGIVPVTAHNAKYKTTGTAAELVKIQYHAAFPGADPIHDLNPQMHNARTAFYGITQSPTMRIDGSYQTGNVLTWIDPAFDDRVLEPAGIRIKISTDKQSSGEVKVNINIENISGVTIPLNGANLFTAIVQKSITTPALLGNSGNAEFVYVAKEFLPSTSGKKITSDLLPGKTYKDSVMWNNLTGDAIVVFVQNIDGNNKNVFQSQINLTPDLPNLVTAIENMLPEQINIYPNPASHEFKVEIPAYLQQEARLHLIDITGRKHAKGLIPSGSNSTTVNVEDLSEGIYILEIGSNETGIIRKKIMVVMKN